MMDNGRAGLLACFHRSWPSSAQRKDGCGELAEDDSHCTTGVLAWLTIPCLSPSDVKTFARHHAEPEQCVVDARRRHGHGPG